jgi:hypothetical protein
MNVKLLVATLAAVAMLGASVADAAGRKGKRHKVTRAPAPVVVQSAAPYAYRPAPGVPANRPPWAGPNECFTDEGYGRFTPCDISKDNF